MKREMGQRNSSRHHRRWQAVRTDRRESLTDFVTVEPIANILDFEVGEYYRDPGKYLIY